MIAAVLLIALSTSPVRSAEARPALARETRVAELPKGQWKTKLKEVKKLYLQQRYEELLPVLDVLLKEDLNATQRVTALRYQAFTLFVLKLPAEAQTAWRRLLEIEPTYRLSADDASPEFVAFFSRITPPSQPPPEPPATPPPATPPPASPASAAPPVAASTPTPAAPNEPGPTAPVATPTTAKESPPATSPTTSGATVATTGPEGARAGSEVIDAVPAPEPGVNLTPTDLGADAEAPRGCGIVLCLIPGGVGQYANGQIVKGVIFSVLEVGALATNLALYWGPAIGDDNAQIIVQRTAFVTLFASIALGILDAFLLY